MKKAKRDVVVSLLSGGIDSTVLLHWLAREPETHGLSDHPVIHAIHFNFGYKSSNTAEQCVGRQAHETGANLHVYPLRGLWLPGYMEKGTLPVKGAAHSMLTRKGTDKYWERDYDYKDGRGVIMLGYAMALASKVGAKQIFVAHQQDAEEQAFDGDNAPTLDGGPAFLDAMQEVIWEGGMINTRHATIRAPFITGSMTKNHIIALGQRLGVDFNKTMSCDYAEKHCGKCDGCLRRFRVLKNSKSL